MTSGPAEVFDLGYQGYEGERTDRWARRRAIWRDGIRISLGLGRGTGAKVAPWLLLGLALVPMVVLVVVSAFVGPATDPDDFELPSYADYYEWAMVPLGLFAAVVAPLLICPDRRDGVLALYAARPITPLDYVGARWAAFLTVALAAAWLPEAVLFAWNALDAREPGTFLADNWDVVPRFLARRRGRRGGADDTRAARRLVRHAARLRLGRRCSPCSSSAPRSAGSRRRTSRAGVADAFSLASIPQALVDAVTGSSATRSTARSRAGSRCSGSSGSRPCSPPGSLRRTNRLVRG